MSIQTRCGILIHIFEAIDISQTRLPFSSLKVQGLAFHESDSKDTCWFAQGTSDSSPDNFGYRRPEVWVEFSLDCPDRS
ncbi:hypothetical protein Tco_0450735 [Tanacetum coccineum]